jgi:hypothetical protein
MQKYIVWTSLCKKNTWVKKFFIPIFCWCSSDKLEIIKNRLVSNLWKIKFLVYTRPTGSTVIDGKNRHNRFLQNPTLKNFGNILSWVVFQDKFLRIMFLIFDNYSEVKLNFLKSLTKIKTPDKKILELAAFKNVSLLPTSYSGT